MNGDHKAIMLLQPFGEKPKVVLELVIFKSRLGPPSIRFAFFGEFEVYTHARI